MVMYKIDRRRGGSKNRILGQTQKMYNYATDAANHFFFDSHCLYKYISKKKGWGGLVNSISKF